MKTIAFFNNKGGVGKTTLVYHLAWMFAEHGLAVLAADLDPQSNLTSMFLEENKLEAIWDGDEHPDTIYGAIRPILRGTGDIGLPRLESVAPGLSLLPGDLGLSRFEDKLSDAWPRCHNGDESAYRIMSAFHRVLSQAAGKETEAVLIDVGPNLGAINRAALIAADHVVIPLSSDLFSLQGLKNLGPALAEWRTIWKQLREKSPAGLSLPRGSITPAGYVVMQHSVRETRPVKAYQRWMERFPTAYRSAVLHEEAAVVPDVEHDPYRLKLLKHYRSLMPMAMEARKPMFHLRAADGAIGAHQDAVKACYDDFLGLAEKIAAIAGLADTLSPKTRGAGT